MADQPYYFIDPDAAEPGRMRRERDKARRLRKSRWWQAQLSRGRCYYCQTAVSPADLTMDHLVPLARGGSSTRGNLVPACRACNQSKRLETPAEQSLRSLRGEQG